jgi:hypothetical protein
VIGPRNSVVRILLGEHIPLGELLADESEFVDTDTFRRMPWYDRPPEFWADKIHDFVGEELL